MPVMTTVAPADGALLVAGFAEALAVDPHGCDLLENLEMPVAGAIAEDGDGELRMNRKRVAEEPPLIAAVPTVGVGTGGLLKSQCACERPVSIDEAPAWPPQGLKPACDAERNSTFFAHKDDRARRLQTLGHTHGDCLPRRAGALVYFSDIVRSGLPITQYLVQQLRGDK
jgi:hypothetical protein